jgi:hypothetical protein
MLIQCRSFIDGDNARVAALEISAPIPRAAVEDINADQIRNEVIGTVREKLQDVQIPEELVEQLRTWSNLVIDLEDRIAAIKFEMAQIHDRRAGLWDGGSPTSATLMALDDAETHQRDQLQAVKTHLETVRGKQVATKTAVSVFLQGETRRIALAETAMSAAETKATEALESFLVKNRDFLIATCRKRVAQYLFRDRPDSWLGSLDPLGNQRAIELLAAPLEVVAHES